MFLKIDTNLSGHLKTKLLVRNLKCTENEALGILVRLWSMTMNHYPDGNLGRIEPLELALMLEWSGEPENLIAGLVKCKFLEIEGSDLLVHEWSDHYDNLLRRKEATRARVRKHRETSATKEGSNAEKQHVTRYCNAVTQCNATRGEERRGEERKREENLNTICGNASLVPATPTEMPKKRAKKEKPETPAGSLVWAAYRASMQEHWRLDPPRSAKTASQAKQLAELLGVERATKLAAYYPTRRSNWYVSKGHPFGLLLTDHMALLRELENGIKFTPQVVKRIVDKEETETSCQVMELMPEENVLCMSDEEFAAWQAKKQAFLEANEKLQIGGDHEIF